MIAAEPDGQLNFEWSPAPRRLLTVSISACGTVWAALIDSEDPRGSCQFSRSVSVHTCLLDRSGLRMIDSNHVPPVGGAELLARFIVNGNEVRVDGTVRPQSFLPYKRVELSVNRHRDATSDETWAVGFQVAGQRGKTLLGRADIRRVPVGWER